MGVVDFEEFVGVCWVDGFILNMFKPWEVGFKIMLF